MGAAAIFSGACILIPMIAWAVINQDWQFQVPLLELTYKPWRFYFVVCSLPELFVGIILLFLPESPRFVLSQGSKLKAYDILKQVNRWNNGKDSPLEPFEIIEETESIENRQRMLECKKSRFPLLESIWIQTAPIFKPPYLRSTILICVIQFGSYATCNGFVMFFGHIMNQMAFNVHSFMDDRIMMCDAINMKANFTDSNLDKVDSGVSVELK